MNTMKLCGTHKREARKIIILDYPPRQLIARTHNCEVCPRPAKWVIALDSKPEPEGA